MIGFPHETIGQIKETFNFARELKARFNYFSIVLPYPGTKLFEQAKTDGFLILDDDSDLENYDCRKSEYLVSDEWTYDQLKEMAYDANIEMNFLNNPCLSSEKHIEYFQEELVAFLRKIPDHIIVRMIIGYIYNLKGNLLEYERYYDSAIELFENNSLHDTFYKYVCWDNPVIRDFNRYLVNKDARVLQS